MQQGDIKIYQDAYADKESVLVGFKGKRIDKPGIFFCPYAPYVKPSRFRRFINWVKSLFTKKHKAKEIIGL